MSKSSFIYIMYMCVYKVTYTLILYYYMANASSAKLSLVCYGWHDVNFSRAGKLLISPRYANRHCFPEFLNFDYFHVYVMCGNLSPTCTDCHFLKKILFLDFAENSFGVTYTLSGPPGSIPMMPPACLESRRAATMSYGTLGKLETP